MAEKKKVSWGEALDESGKRFWETGIGHTIADALDYVKLPGQVAKGEVSAWDPETGHVSDDVIRKSAGGTLAMGLGSGAVQAAKPGLAPGDDSFGVFVGRKGGERLGKGMEREVAEGLYKQGFPIEDIRQQTGWSFGPRGEHDWQYEISDRDMHVKPHALVDDDRGGMTTRDDYFESPPLADALHHPEFLTAYPEAADLRLQAGHHRFEPPGGAFDSQNGSILAQGMDEQEMREILAHELQHASDSFERKPGGSSPRWTRGVIETQVLKELPPEEQAIYHALSEKEKNAIAYRRYRHDAGEVNAEITRNRLDLTPEQRREREPMMDLPKDIDPDLITLGRASAHYGSSVKPEMAIKGYHGSPHDFDQFDFSKAGSTTDPGALGRAGYFSDDARTAATSPHRYEVDLDISNPLNLEMPDFKTRKVDVVSKALGIDPPKNRDEMADWSQRVTDLARARGHDSVILDNSPTGYNGREIAVFDDKVVKILRKYGVAGLAEPALGQAVKPEMAKLAEGIDDKTYWSDLAKTKLRTPIEDMTATRVPTGELADRRIVSPEALQGSILTPAVGDRTAAGSTLTHINDKPLAKPVSLEGGPDFMRAAAAQKEGSAWASDKGVITRLAKLARSLDEGRDINMVYSAMGARSGDYSHMMSDALLAQIPGAKLTKKAAAGFDSALRERFPDWPGLNKPEAAREALLKNGPLRKTFVEEMALGKYQEAGFPDAGSTRFGISEPALIGQPTGASGYAISKLDPSGRVIADPAVPHSTYNTQLGGLGYVGGLEQSVPREVMFPEFFKGRRKAGAPPLADDRAFTMSNVSQEANDEWLEGVMRFLEQERSSGGAR